MDGAICRKLTRLPQHTLTKVISTIGRISVPAILIGIMLTAWPVLAQDDVDNPSDSSWYSSRSGKRLKLPATSPYEEPERDTAPQEHVPSAATSHRETTVDTEYQVAETAFRGEAYTETAPPERLSSQPDNPEQAADITPYDDSQAGRLYSTDGYSAQWETQNDWNSYSYGPAVPWYPRLHNHLWVRSEYLLWWTQGSHLPPLVTTSSAGTDISEAGVLGQSTTSILFGNGTVNTDATSGMRILFGYWFDDCQSLGVEASYVGLGRETARFAASSPSTSIIARPFYDTQFSTQSAMLAAFPDYLEGTVDCNLTSEFQAIEVLLRRNMFRGNRNRLDLLLGWRFARLDESLRINQYSEWPEAQGPIAAGTTKSIYDMFDAQNQFNGAELGVMYRKYAGRWSWETVMKLGLGCTHSRMLIDGMTTTTVPNVGTDTDTGGLLAQETNIGQYSHDRFAVVPELGVTLSYALTNRLHATFGYTFLYWSKVARPADQLDTNASQLPPERITGSQQPAFQFITSDYWAQGMNFGLEYCF